MWEIQLPYGDRLDLPADFSLGFELNNQVFSKSDTSALPGSFSFPVSIPLTGRNKNILGHPDRIDNIYRWEPIENVVVKLFGKNLFTGTLSIRAASETSVKINVVANPMQRLKGIELPELELGGPRTWTGGLLAHMLDTARFPEDHDYVFFTVLTEDVSHNIFDSSAGAGYFVDDTSTITPFVKLKYLLDQLFLAEIAGYKFVNDFQLTAEMSRIYLYNNVDSRILSGSPAAPALPTSINLKNHVPRIKGTDLLRKTAGLFGLGLYTDVWGKKIKIIPLETLLHRAVKHNWTTYLTRGYEITEPDPAPDGFNYSYPELPPGFPDPSTLQTFNTTIDYTDAAGSLPDGFYYIESQALIVKKTGALTESINAHKGVYFGNENPYDLDLEHLFSNVVVYQNFANASRWVGDDEIPPNYEFVREDFPLMYMFYRGIQQVIDSPEVPRPLACSHVYAPTQSGGVRNEITVDGVGIADAERSLYWHGEYGLYNKAHKTWNEMLRNGKRVLSTFVLPVETLIEFSFEDKIRVLNMDFFVRRLRIREAKAGGVVVVEADLVSII